ncbi:hypothetical protein BaRGS_00036497, partial [Batillaria attramentaria]
RKRDVSRSAGSRDWSSPSAAISVDLANDDLPLSDQAAHPRMDSLCCPLEEDVVQFVGGVRLVDPGDRVLDVIIQSV